MSDELMKSIDRVADIVQPLCGPMADELGQVFADKVRVYRGNNLVATMEKIGRILGNAGLIAHAVPPRLLFPIVEAMSVEDDETLQEMWAGLLATASQETHSISPSFAETLKQLTPDEARYLERVREIVLSERNGDRLIPDMALPGHEAFQRRGMSVRDVPWGTFGRLGLVQREYEGNAFHAADGDRRPTIETEVDYWFAFNEYGVSFLDACCGHSKSS